MSLATIRRRLLDALENKLGDGWHRMRRHPDLLLAETGSRQSRAFGVAFPDTARLGNRPGRGCIHATSTLRVRVVWPILADDPDLSYQQALREEDAVIGALQTADLNGLVSSWTIDRISRTVDGDGQWHITDMFLALRHPFRMSQS